MHPLHFSITKSDFTLHSIAFVSHYNIKKGCLIMYSYSLQDSNVYLNNDMMIDLHYNVDPTSSIASRDEKA